MPPPTPPLTPWQRAEIEQRLRVLARLMDAQFELPGTRFRFGLDALIGLVPGLGDAVTTAISAYIIAEARRLGVSRWVLARMIANVALDALVGAIPLAGDLFDAAFKANLRNLRLLGINPGDPATPAPPGRKFVPNEAAP